MVTLHEVITFLVSMHISISSLPTHSVNRCGSSRHLARKLSLRRMRSSPNVFEMAATESITSIILIKLVRVFFFSSRRRHTRLQGDWSSDVCSSDLARERSARAQSAGTGGGAQPPPWGAGQARLLHPSARHDGRPRELGGGDEHRARRRSEERRVGKECRSRWSPYH